MRITKCMVCGKVFIRDKRVPCDQIWWGLCSDKCEKKYEKNYEYFNHAENPAPNLEDFNAKIL